LTAIAERASAAGISPASIALDPGIGFAKTAEQSLEILASLGRFVALGFPVMVGPSRKSFIGHVTARPPEARSWGTAAAVAIAVQKGASMIRVHDVAEMRDVALVAHAIASSSGAASSF
jgi:dihydropteroate synthase